MKEVGNLITAIFLIFSTLVSLKLSGFDISWWMVFAPIWGPTCTILVAIGIYKLMEAFR